MSIHDTIKEQINAADVVLYMKGTELFPQCGFSSQVVSMLKDLGATFSVHNVLESDDIRQGIKTFSNWPTIPQLYVRGEFLGGCDIITEMYENGELAELLKAEA